MTESAESKNAPDDYYFASMENGLFTMQPFCGCGYRLDEDYFCKKCRKTCRCRLIVCEDAETLALARRYVQKSSRFSGFRVKLAEDR